MTHYLKLLITRLLIIFFNLINIKRDQVFIHGIQRSGTNFLAYILTLNHINVLNKNYFRNEFRIRNKPGYVHYCHLKSNLFYQYNGKKKKFKSISDYNKFLGYPNAKHIILLRNEKAWLKSIKNYVYYLKENVKPGHKVYDLSNKKNDFFLTEREKFYKFYKKNKFNSNILFIELDDLIKNQKGFSQIEKFLNKKIFIKTTNLYVSLYVKNLN